MITLDYKNADIDERGNINAVQIEEGMRQKEKHSPQTQALAQKRVCRIAPAYPKILKNVDFSVFLINRSISLTDPRMLYRVLPHPWPSHVRCRG